MNKTWKTILKILGYVISFLLTKDRKRIGNREIRVLKTTMENTRFKISQYACAVLLIMSSIALVAYQVVSIEDVAAGLLYYVAQSFLLAGSIFGLDQYIKIIKRNEHGTHKTQ